MIEKNPESIRNLLMRYLMMFHPIKELDNTETLYENIAFNIMDDVCNREKPVPMKIAIHYNLAQEFGSDMVDDGKIGDVITAMNEALSF